jgi:hypothetical protein
VAVTTSGSESSADLPADEILLITGAGQVLPSARALLAALAVLAVVTWLVIRLRHDPWPTGPVSVIVGGLVAIAAMWVVIRRVEWLVARWIWRDRLRPAMRLSSAGLDYSPSYAGDFPVHIDWNHALSSGFRRGPAGTWYWCLIAAQADGLGPLECVLERGMIVDPGRAREFASGQVAIAAALGATPGDVDLLTHLLAFGTPIAIDLSHVDPALLHDVDARVREWTQGRCSMRRRRRRELLSRGDSA